MSLGTKLIEFIKGQQLTISKKIALVYGLMFFVILGFLNFLSYSGIQLLIESNKAKDVRNSIISIFVMLTVITFIASVVIGYLISKRMIGRVEDIAYMAKNISENDLNIRMDTTGPKDELRDLKITFNEMIERLEEAFVKQKQFVSDASHELRTPLTVIQGYTNMLNRWGKEDREILEESIEAIHGEVQNMNILIERLLLLARYDHKNIKLDMRKIDLSVLIKEVVKETSIVLGREQIKLDIQEDHLYMKADGNLIKQLIRIILDNAIKYTESHQPISITAYRDERVVIIIEDSGIGIPEKELPHVFERFYRADKSRAKETGGHGLGLNIAKVITALHHGKISIQSQVGRGTKVKIEI